MIDFDDFCAEIFQILRAYGRDMVLYDENGNRVYEPTEARRMYVTGDNILVSILEDGDNSSMRLYLSPSMNLTQVKGFIETLRTMASKANLLFHVKKFDKEITPQEFATKASVNEQEKLNMNILEGMYGTSKSSYLKLENARMIVRHNERVKENMIGARGRAIDKIFVENASGERFMFPVNMLSGARAMTQHVNQGGTFADEVGQQIIRMARDFRDLARVAQHTQVNKSALPEQAQGLRGSVMEAMKGLKLRFNRIYEVRSYVRESQRILEANQLMEDDDQIAEKLEMLKDLLGEGLDDTVLATVARHVELPDVQDPVIEEVEMDEVVSEDEEASPTASEDAPSDVADEGDVQTEGVEDQHVFGDIDTWKQAVLVRHPGAQFKDMGRQMLATTHGVVGYYNYHDDNRVYAHPRTDENEMPAPNNSVIKQFEAWMEEFSDFGSQPVAEETTDDYQLPPGVCNSFNQAANDWLHGIEMDGDKDVVDVSTDSYYFDPATGQYVGVRTVYYRDAYDLDQEGDISFHDISFYMVYGQNGALVARPDYIYTLNMKPVDCKSFDESSSSQVSSSEKLDELRVKKLEEPGMSVHDIKSSLNMFKSKLDKLSPFDSEYAQVRGEITKLERDLKKAALYGKATTESEQVDEYVMADHGTGKPNLKPGFYVLDAHDDVSAGPFQTADQAKMHCDVGCVVSHWTGTVWGDMDESVNETFDVEIKRLLKLAGRK